MKDDFAFLLLSCDKYSDMWAPFFFQFRKYFPINGIRIYVGSNALPCEEPGVVPVLSGDDPDWSTSSKRILAQISERKLFVILEDLLVTNLVDEQLFNATIDYMFATDAKHIKYWPLPKPDLPTDHSQIWHYLPGAPYRATVCGLWDRQALMDLLIEGESPWNFEIHGSYRTSYSYGYYGLSKPLFEYRNMIEKGRWLPSSLAWAKSRNILLQLDARPMLRGSRQLISRMQMLYFRFMLRVPWQKRLALMNKLRKLLIAY